MNSTTDQLVWEKTLVRSAWPHITRKSFFDKINRRFKFTVVSVIQKIWHDQVLNSHLHD